MGQSPAQARSGDREAWGAIIGPYLRPLKRFAARQLPAAVRATMSADDLVQEALMHGIAHLDRFEFRHKNAFYAYLRTSIHHRIVDELRKVHRRPAAVPLTDQVDPARSPLQQVIDKQNAQRYSMALARLRDRDRQLIVMRVEQHLAYSDIAARLGIATAHAVQVAVRRALHRLARTLEQVKSVEPADPAQSGYAHVMPRARVNTLTGRTVHADRGSVLRRRERIAGVDAAGFESTAQPLDSLSRGAVRERLGHDASLRLSL